MTIYGQASTSEDIFERMEIEQKVWKSIEKGINCKNYFRKILLACSYIIHLWSYWSWKNLYYVWQSWKESRYSTSYFRVNIRLYLSRKLVFVNLLESWEWVLGPHLLPGDLQWANKWPSLALSDESRRFLFGKSDRRSLHEYRSDIFTYSHGRH